LLLLLLYASAGPKAVSDNHKLVWPEGKFDLCGEPANKNPKRWNYPRTPAGACSATTAADYSTAQHSTSDTSP
jgi:hypothetical protein